MSDGALAIASAVRAGRVRARDVAAAALERIGKRDGAINSFTAVTAEAALRDAERIDAAVAAGVDPGPLAGAPFAVKNLFDVAGMVTLAGSRINADRPPAVRDAVVVAALRRAGAVLVGALNMDEYAYGFYTQPISFIGLPVLAAPIARPGLLPRGIQTIGAPFSEALLFRVAAALEAMGVVGATLAEGAHG